MLGLVSAFLFAGYMLVYAAVADGGRFAATPWESLRASAYDGPAGGDGAAGSSTSHHETTIDKIIGIAGGLLP